MKGFDDSFFLILSNADCASSDQQNGPSLLHLWIGFIKCENELDFTSSRILELIKMRIHVNEPIRLLSSALVFGGWIAKTPVQYSGSGRRPFSSIVIPRKEMAGLRNIDFWGLSFKLNLRRARKILRWLSKNCPKSEAQIAISSKYIKIFGSIPRDSLARASATNFEKMLPADFNPNGRRRNWYRLHRHWKLVLWRSSSAICICQ